MMHLFLFCLLDHQGLLQEPLLLACRMILVHLLLSGPVQLRLDNEQAGLYGCF